jgi:hypothetical protein
MGHLEFHWNGSFEVELLYAGEQIRSGMTGVSTVLLSKLDHVQRGTTYPFRDIPERPDLV